MDKQCFYKSLKDDYTNIGIIGGLLAATVGVAYAVYWLSENYKNQMTSFATQYGTGYNTYLILMLMIDLLLFAAIIYSDPHNKREPLCTFWGFSIIMLWVVYLVVAICSLPNYPSYAMIETLVNIIGMIIITPIVNAYAKCR
jgi:hypothetical protein